MGGKTILKKHQKIFLDLVLREPYLLKNFYWTGGTVLSEIYLKHRESYDVDLFSEREIHLASINKFVRTVGIKLKTNKITYRRYLGLYSYVIDLGKEQLKVDFNFYPFPRINRGKKWKGLEIDSIEDIAANKIHILSTKPRDRDFIDIYFILKKENYSLQKLVDLARAKFDWPIDPIQLGQTFSEAVLYKDIPKMLVPFDKKDMEEFFLTLAKSLEHEIFR